MIINQGLRIRKKRVREPRTKFNDSGIYEISSLKEKETRLAIENESLKRREDALLMEQNTERARLHRRE